VLAERLCLLTFYRVKGKTLEWAFDLNGDGIRVLYGLLNSVKICFSVKHLFKLYMKGVTYFLL
jgi:hypothetical protein